MENDSFIALTGCSSRASCRRESLITLHPQTGSTDRASSPLGGKSRLNKLSNNTPTCGATATRQQARRDEALARQAGTVPANGATFISWTSSDWFLRPGENTGFFVKPHGGVRVISWTSAPRALAGSSDRASCRPESEGQLKAQGPSSTCNESKEEEEEAKATQLNGVPRRSRQEAYRDTSLIRKRHPHRTFEWP